MIILLFCTEITIYKVASNEYSKLEVQYLPFRCIKSSEYI